MICIAEIARKNQLVILNDEIFGEVHHRGEHYSMAIYYPEATIIRTGLSKWCGAGGWGLGCFIFPDALSELQNSILSIASESYFSACTPIQYAAVTAYNGNAEIYSHVSNSRKILPHIGQFMHSELKN